MDFYKIDYIDNSFDTKSKLVTNPQFILSLMRLPSTELDIRNIRNGVEKAKLYLPAVVWGGHFKFGRRRQDEVESSGLFCQDIDHISKDPTGAAAYYEQYFRGREDELGIVFAHTSPSGTGLHVVCLCPEGMSSIPDCQAWLAKETASDYDAKCKDMGRIYYLGMESEILYNDLLP